jgi:hypothetical protein
MKASLNKSPKIVSNWKQHPASSIWLIIDWDGEYFQKNKELKPDNTGGCCVYTLKNQPNNIDLSLYSVRIHSKEPMEITSLGLKNNAWRTNGFGQCDAILFPSSDNSEDALLLVETKYSENEDSWQNYKDHALKQITDTISQFSKKGCPITKRNLFGLISCPLLNTVGASAFSPKDLMDIYNQHKLSIHMGNSATFQDAQNISFI